MEIRTIDDLRKLIKAQTPESLHLEYKCSKAKKKDLRNIIAKTACAFANSDGGTLVLGVREENGSFILDEGYEINELDADSIDNYLTSNISPKLPSQKINKILSEENRAYYTIEIEKSFSGPHQNIIDKLFYRRSEKKSEPMAEHEIKELRYRNFTINDIIDVRFSLVNGHSVVLKISNTGNCDAKNVKIIFNENLDCALKKETLTYLENGIPCIHPGESLSYHYGWINEIFNDEAIIKAAQVNYFYLHSMTDANLQGTTFIDINKLLDTALVQSDIYGLGEMLSDKLKKICKALNEISNSTKNLNNLSAPTGLKLSDSSVEKLRLLLGNESNIERINPKLVNHKAFQEYANLSKDKATILEHKIRKDYDNEELFNLEDLNFLTEEEKERLKQRFSFC